MKHLVYFEEHPVEHTKDFLSKNGSHPESPLVKEALERAKQLVSLAYYRSRNRGKALLAKGSLSASDLLSLFKHPEDETNVAVQAAELMDTAVELIRQLVYTQEKRNSNITGILSGRGLSTLAKVTGCAAQLQPIKCSDSCLADKYRSIDGTCNNRKNPLWGAANTAYARWLPADYEDGFSVPKGWNKLKVYKGFPLPLVRRVSHEILHTQNENISLDTSYTHMLVEWGQWIDHDMDLTPQSASTISFMDGTDCSRACINQNPCFPIQIPAGDLHLGEGAMECLPFIRSSPACGSGESSFLVGKLQPREQLNSLTSFVDGSMIYGSTASLASRLRNLSQELGLLAINQEFSDGGLPLLPFAERKFPNPCALTRNCLVNASDIPCFLAGDSRSNEHLGMQVLHTVFLRESNRIAATLHKLNPQWSGETLYQETRKIIGAFLQIINWRDYVPKILGPEATKTYLPPYSGYNESVDPSISNVFATAAFRFAHVTINPFVSRLDENYEENPHHPSISLHQSFFSPWRIIEEGGIDPILRGEIFSCAKLQTPTQMMPEELTEKLFHPQKAQSLDLAALNLQRGRDHGLLGYNSWRRFCGLPEAHTFSDLQRVLNSSYLAHKLLKLYETPENIDIWIGAIAEPLLPYARVGELLACLLGRQFQALRNGDRFWWENEGVFTPHQREQLAKVTLSQILCQNTHLHYFPTDAFASSHFPDDFVSCKSPQISRVDLTAWKEDPTDTPCGPVPLVKGAYFVRCKLLVFFECRQGYTLEGPSSIACDAEERKWSTILPVCQDINECKPSRMNPCPSSLICVNTPGGFKCACEGSMSLSQDGTTCIKAPGSTATALAVAAAGIAGAISLITVAVTLHRRVGPIFCDPVRKRGSQTRQFLFKPQNFSSNSTLHTLYYTTRETNKLTANNSKTTPPES
ncbi:eosinophil peroxidase-like [Eublepharis macularius]|uniref:Thyroid peroxidase n=1 Tax=Eublepharis macularius TaxID=481883 RepID=A0AA97IUU9_EUBMA|nr:eosinophil peroxidase-like [Eublepharis macularius]